MYPITMQHMFAHNNEFTHADFKAAYKNMFWQK